MRTALAFMKRDGLIMISYRTAFVMQIFGIFLSVPIFFFMGNLFEGTQPETLERYGGNYFAFLLVGIALIDYLSVSLGSFCRSLRESQLMGTLEIILLSPTPLSMMLLCSSLWVYLFTTLRFVMYLLAGMALGLELGDANVPAAVVTLALAVASFVPFGVIAASVIMIIKRGNFINTIVSAVSVVLGGVLYPTESLPAWLGAIANLVPFTHAAIAMRLALLEGASLSEIAPQLFTLSVFAGVLLPVAFFMFRYAVRYTKVMGTLDQF